MIVTTSIDLSVKAYRYFLHQAEKYEITPEELISNHLESFVNREIEKQIGENE